MTKGIKNQGLITIIYILIIALIATLVLIIGHSRLLLALQRNKSASDSLLTTYQAEYEINDLLLKLTKGSLSQNDFGSFPKTFNIDPEGNFTIRVDAEIDGSEEILTVTAKKNFAVSKIQSIRSLSQANQVTPVDLVLMIDCTTSMRESSGPNQSTTRMQEAKKAALSFVQQMMDHPNGDFVKMGLGVFGTDAAWVKTSTGVDITPANLISLNQVYNTINTSFGSTRENSSACNAVRDFTSVGSAYTFVQDYFATSTSTNKKAEIVITDGEPNTRIEYPKCPVSKFCQNCQSDGQKFLRCAITDKTKKWDSVNFGVRDPQITAYGVTILSPSAPLVEDIFTDAIGESNYFNATTADQLSGILDQIFDKIISSVSKITISRVIPITEE